MPNSLCFVLWQRVLPEFLPRNSAHREVSFRCLVLLVMFCDLKHKIAVRYRLFGTRPFGNCPRAAGALPSAMRVIRPGGEDLRTLSRKRPAVVRENGLYHTLSLSPTKHRSNV